MSSFCAWLSCMTPWALTLPFFVLWSKVRRGGPVRGQARWQVDGTKPMIRRYTMLSYVHHHNIPGAWNIVFTALDNIEVLKVSQNQKRYPTTRVNHTLWVLGPCTSIMLTVLCVYHHAAYECMDAKDMPNIRAVSS